MTVLDFIYGILVIASIIVLFIGWLGNKYDVVGRDERIKELELQIKKYEDKEQRRIEREKKKKEKKIAKKVKKGDAS